MKKNNECLKPQEPITARDVINERRVRGRYAQVSVFSNLPSDTHVSPSVIAVGVKKG